VGVGDHDGTVEKAGVVDPGSACHFAIAVESEPGGEDGVVAGFSARMNGRDASTNWSLADFEFTFAGDERGVADFDSLDVGDGVVGAGSAIEGNAEIAGARLGLSGQGGGQSYDQDELGSIKDAKEARGAPFGATGGRWGTIANK
jgi:hypothetical protein